MAGFDSHCHLDFLEDPGHCMASAQSAGPDHWLVPGTDPDQWQQAHGQFSEEPRVSLAAGHHPWFLPQRPADTRTLVSWLDRQSDCVAIGEIGLDFFKHHPESPPAQHQFDWFLAQLAIARDRNLPVIIHSVKAHDRILQGLKRFPSVVGVVHGFVGPYVQAMAYVDRGFYLGAGSVIFQSAKTLDALARIPAERVLVETDAPDQRIAVQHLSGSHSFQPEGLDNPLLDWPSTVSRLAEARDLKPEVFQGQVSQNATTLFGG